MSPSGHGPGGWPSLPPSRCAAFVPR
jgi:hypothetical protein